MIHGHISRRCRAGPAERFIDATARRPHGPLARWTYGGRCGAPAGHEEIFDQVLDEVGPITEACCLDVGCGGGRLIERLLMFDAARVRGLDHSPQMIAVSATRNRPAVQDGRLELKSGEITKLPWPSESFDVVTSANMFFFVEQPAEALGELCRVLRRGGRLVLVTQPGPLPPGSLRNWWVKVWGSSMHLYDNERMRALLSEGGFDEITVRVTQERQLVNARRPETRSSG